jgi:hypothetical protein
MPDRPQAECLWKPGRTVMLSQGPLLAVEVVLHPQPQGPLPSPASNDAQRSFAFKHGNVTIEHAAFLTLPPAGRARYNLTPMARLRVQGGRACTRREQMLSCCPTYGVGHSPSESPHGAVQRQRGCSAVCCRSPAACCVAAAAAWAAARLQRPDSASCQHHCQLAAELTWAAAAA